MPRRRFRRSRGCGALRVGSAWRLARIILLASFVTNVHAFDAAPARRRGGYGSLMRDLAVASTRACKSGAAAGVTIATPRATQGRATPKKESLGRFFAFASVSYTTLGHCSHLQGKPTLAAVLYSGSFSSELGQHCDGDKNFCRVARSYIKHSLQPGSIATLKLPHK